MKHCRMTSLLLGAFLLLLGAGKAAAINYSGTLDFSNYPTTMDLDVLGTPVTVDIGADIARYDLGNALSGTPGVSFTTHNNFNPDRTLLALLFTSDPNQALFSNPASLTGALNPTTNINTFLDDHVIGWQYFAYGNLITPNGTSNISGLFNPMTFTAGTNYYAFVVGGSTIIAGQLVDPSVGYTLSVGAVPEPGEYAMLIAGLGLIGAMQRRRKVTASA